MIFEYLTPKNANKYIVYLKKALSIEPDLMCAERVDEPMLRKGICER